MRRSASILILMLILGVMAWAGGIAIHNQEKVKMVVTSTGDTARVIIGEITSVNDSLLYQCSVLTTYTKGVTDTAVAAWTSSPYTMNITPVAHDTFDYSIKIVFDSSDGTPDTLAIEFTTDTAMTVAQVCDSIVSVGEAATTITDSVTFHDSVTYVKVFSNFGNETMDRFILFATDSDSSGVFTVNVASNTIAMTVDSMAAAVNAAASAYVTGSNTGDTGYLVTVVAAGMLFDVKEGDTATDTSVVHAGAIGTAIVGLTDTLGISKLLFRDFSTRSVQARFILNATGHTGHLAGTADSGYLQLFTEFANTWDLLGKDSTASLPCTLYYVLPSAAGTDTLFEENLILVYRVRDSIVGYDDTLLYQLQYDILLKGE